MAKMNPVIHFEMPAKNGKRMAAFYTRAFGWKTEQMGKEMGGYIVVSTTETGEKGPKKPGAINGGFYPRRSAKDSPSVVIWVEDIKAHMKKVKGLGGKILGKPVDIPGVGKYVSFKDTEGNTVSLLQPLRR